MSTTIKLMEPYTTAHLSFAPMGTRHVGDVSAWASADMALEFVSWSSGEDAHITYDVLATDPVKRPGDEGWVIGRVKMTAEVVGEVASSEVLMRRLFNEFYISMRNRVEQGQPLVEFVDGQPVFKCSVTFATV